MHVVDQCEVLSFLVLVAEAFYLPSKRWLAVIIASLSDVVWQLFCVSPPRSNHCTERGPVIKLGPGMCCSPQ